MTADRNHGSAVLHDSNARSPSAGGAAHAHDRRGAMRRVLSCRVALTLPNKEILYGFSVDVSKSGIGINVPRKIPDGQECELSLSFFANGKTHRLNAVGQTLSCVCIGMDGFRISVRFVHLEEGAAEILEQILS
jgi:hypothetical protein